MIGILALTGCATQGPDSYTPYKTREKKAYARADRSITPSDVKTNFQANVTTEVAWVGIIKDIQFRETERTIQVAFGIDHRNFDWIRHRAGKLYHLTNSGEGQFLAGWTVDKPARISHLKTLATPGDMIVVYGKPYKVENGVIQIVATSVRPIKKSKYEVLLPDLGNNRAAD